MKSLIPETVVRQVRLFSLLLLVSLSTRLWAEVAVVEISLELADGNELTIEQLGNGGDRLLWIPSEFSRRSEDERQLLLSLAAAGYQVWWLDLHSHFFIAPGRNSYDKVPLADLTEVIEKSRPESGRLTLVATGRGARIALELARLWQLRHPGDGLLAGAILFHPNLTSGIARAGELPPLHPIAEASNLPIFILQPLDSAKRWYLAPLTEALGRGGSDVFARLIKYATDGFHIRGDATDVERELRKGIPAMIDTAQRLLASVNANPRWAVASLTPAFEGARGKLEGGLQPIANTPFAPPLMLFDIEGVSHDLKRYRGRKVLINFWTTWCPPCVKEIPSLGRLQRQFDKDDLMVLSVDVGEEKERVTDFLSKIPARFPVMLDETGETVKPWKLRAFPTTFLLDRQGRIRYGYYGGLEWDEPEVVELIKALR